MNFNQLEDAQGLTTEMMRDYLKTHGWTLERKFRWKPENEALSEIEQWTNDGWGVMITDTDYSDWLQNLCAAVESIARREECSAQSIIRQINPRIRKGWPSQDAILAHGIHDEWIMKNEEGLRIGFFIKRNEMLSFVYYTVNGEEWLQIDNPIAYSFWPCDENGNKVLWPTDSSGKML